MPKLQNSIRLSTLRTEVLCKIDRLPVQCRQPASRWKNITSTVTAGGKLSVRRMIEHHYSGDSDAIDGWRCSHCRWSRHLDHPISKLDVPFSVRSRAEAAFARHICDHNPK